MSATDVTTRTVARTAAPPKRWGSLLRATLRILLSVSVTILGLLALTFFIGRLLPLDPVLAILGDDASQEAVDRLTARLGLDRPLHEQFLSYVVNSLTFDFGESLTSGRPVIEDIARVFPATLELATLAMIFGTGIGIPLGVLAAANRDSWIDQCVRVISLIGYSAPIFWLGLLGLSIFYAGLGWVGPPGRIDIVHQYDIETWSGLYLVDSAIAGQWDIFADVFGRIVLPASILAYGAMAYISRMTRSFMLEQFGQEYIIAARAKGASKRRVIWQHAFPNIAVQLVTVVALSYAFLLEGAVLTETVFAWPGFGRYLTTALLRADMNAVLGCTLLIGLIFIGLNLLSDLFYRIFDPRTR
ncbi:ABC transporter permease [uncultured Jannaschia sp.]|uniref:ABC transporter permease n=1 Tax=uncultured Jannaschia sp. TaxID=293347 RepID=UPI0026147494|nr:ABC transporter permease [uncultured Jannaschia sp.]